MAGLIMVRKPPASPYRIGRVQLSVRRAFWASRRQELRTSDFLPWCFLASQPANTGQLSGGMLVVRLRRFAERVNGRDQREAIWRLKDGFY